MIERERRERVDAVEGLCLSCSVYGAVNLSLRCAMVCKAEISEDGSYCGL